MVVDIPTILVGVSWLARWLFERVGGDARTVIHLEGIIGAFLAAFVHSLRADLPFVAAIVGILLATKWLAATTTGRMFDYTTGQTLTMWSPSVPQVAARLAAALVAYETVNSNGDRLIDEMALNAIIVVMVVTSILGPIQTERFAPRLPDAEPTEAPLTKHDGSFRIVTLPVVDRIAEADSGPFTDVRWPRLATPWWMAATATGAVSSRWRTSPYVGSQIG